MQTYIIQIQHVEHYWGNEYGWLWWENEEKLSKNKNEKKNVEEDWRFAMMVEKMKYILWEVLKILMKTLQF